MFHFHKVLLLTALLCLPSLTLAQTIFDVTGTLALSGATLGNLSGTIDINTQTGMVTGWSISIPEMITPYGGAGGYVLNPADSELSLTHGSGVQDLLFSNSSLPELSLVINGTTLQGFAGSPIMNQSQFFFGDGRPFYDIPVTAGSLTPMPEPSSLILTMSGLAGLAAFRRRLFRY
jgi:hypothetical protein